MSVNRSGEFCDIYDSNKKPTGKITKRGDFILKDGEFHLVVLAVLCTEDNKVLITKRSIDKKWAPGHWEIPGGGVKAGESSVDAVSREVLEETNIILKGKSGKLLYTYKRENPSEGDNYFVDVYGFKISKDDIVNLKIQAEEMTDYRFASIIEIEEIAKRDEFLHFDSIKEVLYSFIK